MLFDRKFGEINVVLWSSDEINKLAHLSPVRGFVERLEEMNVVWLRSEVLLQEMVYSALEHERVIDRDISDAIEAVIAWLAAAGDGCVHDIVRDEEECLEELDAPSQECSLEVLVIGERSPTEDLDAVYNGHAAVELASGHIVVQITFVPVYCILSHVFALHVFDELIADGVEHLLELRALLLLDVDGCAHGWDVGGSQTQAGINGNRIRKKIKIRKDKIEENGEGDETDHAPTHIRFTFWTGKLAQLNTCMYITVVDVIECPMSRQKSSVHMTNGMRD